VIRQELIRRQLSRHVTAGVTVVMPLGFRPAMRRDWAGALAAMQPDEYVNELGIRARADRLEEVERERVFNDAIDADVQVSSEDDLAVTKRQA